MKKTIWITILLLVGGAPGAFAQLSLRMAIGYDELGQVANFDYPDGSRVNYLYDNEVGVASQVTYEGDGEIHDFVQGVDLNESGLMQRVVIDGGEKTYDSLNQLIEQRFDYGGTTWYHASDMAYNQFGGLKSLNRQDGSVTAAIQYGYTEQGQLRRFQLGAASATYRYDARGNLTSVDGFATADGLEVPDYDAGPAAFDTGNHHVGWEYDANGRLLKDDARQYYYDATGRLAMVRDLATGLPLQTNLYDGAGNRVRSSDILAGSVTYSVRDTAGAVITEKVDSTNEPDRTTNYIQHQGQTIATMTRLAGAASPKKTQIFTDHLGSPAVIVAESVVTNHEYGPFGQQLSVPQHAGAHGYTDHEDDAATALTYMMARYYNQAAARFLTPDPARDFNRYLPSSYNLYQYVYNDPIFLLDPTGFGPETGREWAVRKEGDAFRGHNEVSGYLYMGLSGFLGLADGISKVANYWAFGAQDELDAWDYGNAALNLLEILPALKWFKLKSVGSVANVASDAATTANTAKRGGSSLIALEEAAFVAALKNGPETISGFQVFGNKGLVGKSFNRNIFLLESNKRQSIAKLLKAFEAEAKAAGAEVLNIKGLSVINPKLINPKVAEKFGYIFRQINEDTIELVKVLR